MRYDYTNWTKVISFSELSGLPTLRSPRENQLWKPVMDFPDYFISTHGNVRSIRTGKLKDLRPRQTDKGYLFVTLTGDDGDKCHRYVHQLVCGHFIGELSSVLVVNHKDLNKLNNHYQNLEQITQTNNIKHAFRLIMPRRYNERYEWPVERFA